jgi:hypothetical protein
MSRACRHRWLFGVSVLLMAALGCGYHTSGNAVRLPTDLQTLYVPAFVNSTQTYGVEQTLTAAVVRELRSRTKYQIVSSNDGTADATLTGVVTTAATAPLTYDSVTGRISSGVVTVTMSVSLVNRNGKTLWSNPNYLYREQYQVSTNTASFFEEEGPALERIARDFSHSLVSDILEAY